MMKTDILMEREMTEKIRESGTNPQEAAELARKKGMAKGTAGVSETGSEYEKGAGWIKQISIP